SRGDWLGKSVRDLVVESSAPAMMTALSRCASGEAVPGFETHVRHQSGNKLVLERLLTPARTDTEVVAIRGIARDGTTRRQTEDELRRTEAELRHVQKMDALGHLAGGVAHDFNNVLTVILGCGNLLLRGTPDRVEERTLLLEIVKAGERAASLTRQLLAF